MDLANINQRIKKIKRQDGQGELQDIACKANPFEQFIDWFNEVLDSGIYDPSAMVLATVDQTGRPDTRVVLLKELEENRFIFFTNYTSKKAQDLAVNNFVAVNFYWPSLVRQVRIRGFVVKVDREKSANYFATRPREAQLGVYASNQSTVIPNREALDAKFQRYSEEFAKKDIPCPDYWGGYALTPIEYEFFQGRKWRSHDRIFYSIQDNQWHKVRLSP